MGQLLIGRGSIFDRRIIYNPTKIDISRIKIYLIEEETELLQEISDVKLKLLSLNAHLSSCQNDLKMCSLAEQGNKMINNPKIDNFLLFKG